MKALPKTARNFSPAGARKNTPHALPQTIGINMQTLTPINDVLLLFNDPINKLSKLII